VIDYDHVALEYARYRQVHPEVLCSLLLSAPHRWRGLEARSRANGTGSPIGAHPLCVPLRSPLGH